jgi:hypothetical protein
MACHGVISAGFGRNRFWIKLEITPPSISNHSRYGTDAGVAVGIDKVIRDDQCHQGDDYCCAAEYDDDTPAHLEAIHALLCYEIGPRLTPMPELKPEQSFGC